MNAPQILPNRDMSDCADGALREQAIESLTYKIMSGKHRNGIFELLDSELNTDRYKILLEEITMLILNESGEREYLAEKIRDGLIERYLSTHGDLVEEEANEIEAKGDDE
jgi:hypothetical protein